MRTRSLLWCAVAPCLVALPRLALGQELPASEESTCVVDEECPQGFVCEVVSEVGCAVAPCEPGAECPAPEPCESAAIYGCVPGPCQSDADCGDGMVCLTQTITRCSGSAGGSGGAPEPGADAGEAPDSGGGEDTPDAGGDATPPCEQEPCESEEPVCETETVQACVPAWVAPCSVDADCGPEGFVCEELEVCSCTSYPEGGEAPEDDCTCEPTGERYCRIVEQSCTTSEQCAEGWSCTELQEGPVDCPSTPGGGPNCEPSEPAESESVCTPPYWEELADAYGGADRDTAAGGDPQAPSDPEGIDDELGGEKSVPEEVVQGCAATQASSLATALVLAALLRRRRR